MKGNWASTPNSFEIRFRMPEPYEVPAAKICFAPFGIRNFGRFKSNVEGKSLRLFDC